MEFAVLTLFFLSSKCTKMPILRRFSHFLYGKRLTKQCYFANITFGFEM